MTAEEKAAYLATEEQKTQARIAEARERRAFFARNPEAAGLPDIDLIQQDGDSTLPDAERVAALHARSAKRAAEKAVRAAAPKLTYVPHLTREVLPEWDGGNYGHEGWD